MLLPPSETIQVTKYLVVKRTGGNCGKASPFLIANTITSCTGYQVKEIKKTAVGLIVETKSDDQNKRLLMKHVRPWIESMRRSVSSEWSWILVFLQYLHKMGKTLSAG